MELYKEKVHRLGEWIARRWWDQEVLDLAGTRESVAAAEDKEGGSEGEGEER